MKKYLAAAAIVASGLAVSGPALAEGGTPPEPTGPPEWCSPGYWKNHLDQWAFDPNFLYELRFGQVVLSPKGVKDGADQHPTLLEVVSNPQWYGGEAANNVADKLSFYHPGLNYVDGLRPENCPLN